MGADYSFYVKSIATFALTFFGYIISVLASVESSLATIGCYSIQSNKCIDISPESKTNIVYIYYPVVEKKSKERKKERKPKLLFLPP